jgi:hypothetical protein
MSRVDGEQFLRIHDAFQRGDLAALRAAVGDDALIPNGRLGDGIGTCLVYAIYHSPLDFLRQLLELGADPNVPVDDGFPTLIAAIGSANVARGAAARSDVDEIVTLLLRAGADPHQRAINDYTPLHMAVAERQPIAAYGLLQHGADPELRTRIEDRVSAIDMASAAGLDAFVALLQSRGRPQPRRLRSGFLLLVDIEGHSAEVRRQQRYRIRLRQSVDRFDDAGAIVMNGHHRQPGSVDQRSLLRVGGHARRRSPHAGDRTSSRVRRPRRRRFHPAERPGVLRSGDRVGGALTAVSQSTVPDHRFEATSR